MKMTKNICAILAIAALGTAVVVGCSSSSGDDAGTDTASDGPMLFGLTDGTWCFDVLAISNASDGCDIEVADQVGKALPVKYTVATGMLAVGTDGALGTGSITQNKGTLIRERDTSDGATPPCTAHRVDTSTVELTATNEFTISVVEKQSGFAAACSPIPAGGMCMSSWTWKMKINGAKKPEMKCE